MNRKFLPTICKYHVLSALCGLMIFIVCVIQIPQQDEPITIPYFDKIVHFLMYFIFSLMFLYENFHSNIEKKRKPIKIYFVTIFLSLIIGGIIEIVQSDFTTYRSGDILDWFFDMAGSISAIIIAELFRRASQGRGR